MGVLLENGMSRCARTCEAVEDYVSWARHYPDEVGNHVFVLWEGKRSRTEHSLQVERCGPPVLVEHAQHWFFINFVQVALPIGNRFMIFAEVDARRILGQSGLGSRLVPSP